MVTKQCPNCQQHVPVACKACPCGHIFFVARRAVSIHKTGGTDEGEVKRRRTERTKRERPDYFQSLQVDNELKKMKRQKKSNKKDDNGEKDGDGSNSEDGSEATNRARSSLSTKNKKRGRPKKNFSQDKSESKTDKDEEVDMFAHLSKEREEQFGVILSEINRKMMQQQLSFD
ncbi:UPF0547 domain-containing protein [Caerostris extrusa]|uniref:UPF0547 domain-containing protein n=1 Tax=Caerostris extrusa TaxID=172846 RepID=A0AAV4V495_CAEEX|nr:UPF0547 domain-containing protein [Caerostris extrusa]